MLKKGRFNGLYYPYSLNDVYVNENANGYYFDVSNSAKNMMKVISSKRIRLIIYFWDIKVTRTSSFMKITQLLLMVKIEKNWNGRGMCVKREIEK